MCATWWSHGRILVSCLCAAVVAAAIIGLLIRIAGSQACATSQWNEIWSDDFAGKANYPVDRKSWKYKATTVVLANGGTDTMTSSVSNTHLDGHGDLDIIALQHGLDWTSGQIETKSIFGAPADGEMKVVASIKQPNPPDGLGYWPAFWLLGPGSWPEHGEIDILEDVNSQSELSGTLHCGTQLNPYSDVGPCHGLPGLSSGLLRCDDCQSQYQTYSLIIDRSDPADEKIFWYLNGREFFSVSESQVGMRPWRLAVDHGFSIGLDLAIGGGFPDTRCGCVTPSTRTTAGGAMSVKYVAVYERAR